MRVALELMCMFWFTDVVFFFTHVVIRIVEEIIVFVGRDCRWLGCSSVAAVSGPSGCASGE